MDYSELENNIGYHFKDITFLETALCHRSFRFEQDGVDEDNERLEFLGDAILAFLCAAHLFATVDGRDEGLLTTMRSRASSGKTLAECGSRIELGKWLKMGLGEEQSGGRERPSNIANALEAIIGAAYLDGGIEASRKLFETLFVPLIATFEHDIWAENPKGKLQEQSQSRWKLAPVYRLLKQEGPPHDTTFTIEVSLHDGGRAVGIGSSKQSAEEDAARQLLESLAADEA